MTCENFYPFKEPKGTCIGRAHFSGEFEGLPVVIENCGVHESKKDGRRWIEFPWVKDWCGAKVVPIRTSKQDRFSSAALDALDAFLSR